MTCQVILEFKVEPERIDATRAWFRQAPPDTRAYEGFATLHIAQNQEIS